MIYLIRIERGSSDFINEVEKMLRFSQCHSVLIKCYLQRSSLNVSSCLTGEETMFATISVKHSKHPIVSALNCQGGMSID